MENQGKAHYFAFISHKSADRDFSLKMQQFIENYRLPATLRKNTDFPQRLSPVCCYENDFSSNPLMTEMEEKLSRSQFLIVVCSQDQEPGGSKYVNFEIETFIKQKQAEGIDPLERIIPVIVSGAFDSETEECCPAALKALGENRPIGTDRSKYKSDREVFLHAISGMLNIDYAVMVDRDRKRRKKNAIIAGVAALVAVLLTAAALTYFLPWNRHYVDFVMQKGLPVGIEKLSAKEYKKMNAHYVITTQRGKITQLKYVNSKGSLINHDLHYLSDRPAKYVFSYDSGVLSAVTYYDESGLPYFVMNYYNKDLSGVDLRGSTSDKGVYYVGVGYSTNPQKLLEGTGTISNALNAASPYSGMISRLSYTYNEQGFVTKLLFHADSSGKRVADNNIFGFEYELDDLGRVRKVYYLDISQNRKSNADGVYCTEYIYDENNDLVGLKHYNKSGTLTDDKNGTIHLQWTYDNNHNRRRLDVLDAEGAYMDSSYFNSARIGYSTDQNGNVVYQINIDENNTYNVESGDIIVFAYDENGRVSKRTIVDKDGTPIYSPSLGFANIEYERDSLGRVTGLRFTDVDGMPTNSYDGYAYRKTEYNEAGQTVKIAHFDTDEKPALTLKNGYSIQTREYDALGRMTAVYYRGTNHEPVNTTGPSNSFGYHKCILTYEDQFNGFTKTIQTHYGKDGNLINCLSEEDDFGFAKMVTVSQNGYISFLAIYDQDGKQVRTRHESSRIHNAQAEMEEHTSIINSDDTLAFKVLSIYDGQGLLTRYFSESYDAGLLASSIEEIYDKGKLTEDTYITYNKQGDMLTQQSSQYDENGNPVIQSIDYANHPDMSRFEEKFNYENGVKKSSVNQTWDKDGNLYLQQACMYDAQERKRTVVGKLYENNVLSETWTTQYTYNADGSSKSETIKYDPEGNEIGKNILHYDSDGKIIE